MTHVTIDTLNHGWNLRLRQRTTSSCFERRSWTGPATGGSSAPSRPNCASTPATRSPNSASLEPISGHIAKEATQYNREEEFRSALDNYIADYKSIAPRPRWTRLRR